MPQQIPLAFSLGISLLCLSGCGNPPSEEVCGDSVVQANENCDDGNTLGGDGCSADCSRLEVCGDGITDANEECDDNNTTPEDGCNASCELEACGDGIIQEVFGEQCDDAGAINGDGCDDGCQTEPGFVCDGEPSICNAGPTGVDDDANTTEDTALTIPALTLLSNDLDPENDNLLLVDVFNAVNGLVVLSGADIIFTPAANFDGVGSFDYTLSDGATSDTALVTIQITAVADAPNITANNISGDEDSAILLDVVASLVDADGSEVLSAITINGVPANATLNGLLLTPPANFNGVINLSASATATESSNNDQASTAVNFTVTVNNVNDAPIAADDIFNDIPEDFALTCPTSELLANDADPIDNGALSVVSVQNALNGSVSLVGNTFFFTPSTNFNGVASFEYTISDGQGGFDTAITTLSIVAVADEPIITANNIIGDEDSAIALNLDVALGDTDGSESFSAIELSGVPTGAILSAGVVNQGSTFLSQAQLSGLTLTPPPNFTGDIGLFVVVFAREASNDDEEIGSASFTITVNNVNDAPVAVDDFFVSPGNGVTINAAAGVLLNDTDQEGNTFVVSEVEGSANNVGTATVTDNGVVTVNADGSFTYNPDAGATGDSFSYRVSDGTTSNLAFVSILVAGELSQISTGNLHTCALKTEGTVFCWGENNVGQLGDNTSVRRLTPVQVSGVGGVGFLSNISQISAGTNHTCAVDTSGNSFCWGRNNTGQLGNNSTEQQLTPIQVLDVGGVGTLSDIAQISAGNSHTCAINNSGASFCWGFNSSGRLGDNTTIQRLTPIQVLGVGGSGFLSNISQISSGDTHTCAINNSGASFCWGNNSAGQLADNSTTNRSTPVQVLGVGGVGFLSNISQLSTGTNHTCAVNNSGASFCWGFNSSDQLGNNSTINRSTAVQVLGVGGSGFLSDISQIDAGSAHTCAVNNSGASFCWGNNSAGQLADNSTTNRSTPVQVLSFGVGTLTNITQISSGDTHTCAINNSGASFCWGGNGNGQLGDGTLGNQRNTPVSPQNADASPFSSTLLQISAGSGHTCAVRIDGAVFCWGRNNLGQLGDNSTISRNTPVQVSSPGGGGFLSDISQVDVGGSHTCAVSNSGTSFCWGSNNNNQLGDLTIVNRSTPVRVVNTSGINTLPNVSQISAGTNHTCAVDTSGNSFCWGRNNTGQLGDNSTTNRNIPTQVLGIGGVGLLSNIAQISSGNAHTCAVDSTGASFCWGFNSGGQLGDNTAIQRLTPVQVLGIGSVGTLSNISQISTFQNHTCAVNNSGASFCWGTNNLGQLGDNSTIQRLTPVQVVGVGGIGFLSNISQISSGNAHTCAVNNSGASFCWGFNNNGQLGDNTTIQRNAPVQVLGVGAVGTLSNISQISAGNAHTCAIDDTGASFCWGSNGNGQLGISFFAEEVLFP